jgi:hypothetical protein
VILAIHDIDVSELSFALRVVANEEDVLVPNAHTFDLLCVREWYFS